MIVRNDRLGDFILALPSFSLIKKALPAAEIHALVPAYTAEIAGACLDIDSILLDPGRENGFKATLQLAKKIKSQNYDALIALFSTTHTAFASFYAQIPYRLAPATKIAQFFYNHRLRQQRSASIKPEWKYNIDLAQQFLTDHIVDSNILPEPPYFAFANKEAELIKETFCHEHNIPEGLALIFIHPGHGGSANNLSVDQYVRLVNQLRSSSGHWIVLTAGPKELDLISDVATKINGTNFSVYHSTKGLTAFAKHIQIADVFIGSSTGPLHIAGALDRPTAAFYPRLRTSSAQRWQTLNSPDRRLAFWPPGDAGEEELTAIDVDEAAEIISQTYLLD